MNASTARGHKFVGGPSVEKCERCGNYRAAHEDDGFTPATDETNIQRQYWQHGRDVWRKPGSEPKRQMT